MSALRQLAAVIGAIMDFGPLVNELRRGVEVMNKTTRREFANGMALTAAAAILGLSPKPADAEPPPR